MSVLEDYQEFVKERSFYHDDNNVTQNLAYTMLGLNGEAGECAELVKKFIRGSHKEFHMDDFILELGDVMFYLTAAANEIGIDVEDIILFNKQKLIKRDKEKKQ